MRIKAYKSAVIAMVATLAMTGTITAKADNTFGQATACAASGNSNQCGNNQAAAVPEPTTLALISVGLLGAFGTRRRLK